MDLRVFVLLGKRTENQLSYSRGARTFLYIAKSSSDERNKSDASEMKSGNRKGEG